MPAPHITALRRLLVPPAGARAAEGAARCELCSLPLGERHEHLLDLGNREIACACTACALLFDDTRPAVALGRARWRRIPRDSRTLAGFELSGVEWAALGIPIQLAFLSRNSLQATVIAAYPSPAGAVVASIADDAWALLADHHPELGSLAPDVEALLIQRMETPHQYFITPLDQAYRLTGMIRSAWVGFSGGTEVRRLLAAFCAELQQNARAVIRHAV